MWIKKIFQGGGGPWQIFGNFLCKFRKFEFSKEDGWVQIPLPPPHPLTPLPPPPHTHTWWGSTKGDTSHILCMEYMAFMWLQLTHNLAGDKLLLFIIADPEVFLCCRHLVKWLPSRLPLCVVSHSRVRLQSASATLFVYSSVCFYILFCSFLCFCKYF